MLLLSHLTHATSHPDPHLPNLAGVLPDTELDDLSKLAMISEAADSISEAADSADGGCGTGPAGLYSPPGTNASTWRLRVVGSGDRVRDRAECAPDDWIGAPALYVDGLTTTCAPPPASLGRWLNTTPPTCLMRKVAHAAPHCKSGHAPPPHSALA